ncbi:uroporphyrinogen-III synthase [Terribacillus sp. DMT04]|uniref:uroporphyrinogen-III synthase n=1 Tax=Terribacillus sp. DMT04 TaxID=2850441 RepID=UPI001C2C1F60|nr:uroporphyrinogen-III synthase [Terribacillus sp. DMT04]QXE00586.1 uroporphyrinogen-III synthase [Terribacillus sp. DMT04]
MSRLPAVKVLVTRPKQQTARFAEQLSLAGADPIEVPLLTFQTRDDERNQLLSRQADQYNWLFFSSRNGVKHFQAIVENYSHLDNWRHCRIAAVGQKTADAIEEIIGRKADLVPEAYTADDLAVAFAAAHQTVSRILLVQGSLSRPALANGLSQNDYAFEKMVVYDTVEEQTNQTLLNEVLEQEKPEVLTFTSPSSIEAFFRFIRSSRMKFAQLDKLCLVIGPTTERAAKRHGFHNILVPDVFTAEAMIDTLVHFYEQRTGD